MYKVIVAISLHGYHGMPHLVAMMRYEAERQRDTEYMATILWTIGRMLGGEEYPMLSYGDMVHPQPKDTRNAEEIVGGILSRLKKTKEVNANERDA